MEEGTDYEVFSKFFGECSKCLWETTAVFREEELVDQMESHYRDRHGADE